MLILKGIFRIFPIRKDVVECKGSHLIFRRKCAADTESFSSFLCLKYDKIRKTEVHHGNN